MHAVAFVYNSSRVTGLVAASPGKFIHVQLQVCQVCQELT
jgi:hypothetical protein